MNDKPKDVIRETDAEAVRLAKTLTRTARFGALGVLDPDTGVPWEPAGIAAALHVVERVS